MKFEDIPDHLIHKILSVLQTKRHVKKENGCTRYQMNTAIIDKRKTLINGIGIYTDIETLLTLSKVSKRFNDIITKSDFGKMMLYTYYYSDDHITVNVPEHIPFCKTNTCTNVCHYIDKHINYSDIVKKITKKRESIVSENK